MSILPIAFAVALSVAPQAVDERPLWAGSLQPTAAPVVVSAVAGGIGVRSATAVAVLGAEATGALGAGLCTGATARLGIPAGGVLYLLGPGSPASLVASVPLPSQAVSAAVPLTTSAGCGLAVVLQSGDVAIADASGGLRIVSGVVPAMQDWHELPRGVLVAGRGDLLVAGGVDGSVAAVRITDGKRFAGTIPVAAVPGVVWTAGEDSIWFLGKTGSLHAWKVTSGSPQLVAAGTVAAPGGLVAWGGRSDRGIAWADLQGQVHAWKGSAARQVVRLPGPVRWPMLVADLDDTGDLKLVAPVDGQVAALVAEEESGGSFTLLQMAGRPSGPAVAYQLSLDDPSVLSIPAAATRATLYAAESIPAGQLAHDQAVLVPGVQLGGSVPGPMQAALVVPPPSASGGSGGSGGSGSGTGSGQASTRSGFGCSTAPSSDALPLLLAPALLVLRRRRRPA